MEQNTNSHANQEITFLDLCRLFVSKWKIMLIFALIFAIVGGLIGGLRVYGDDTYGTTMRFNLSPSDSTDALLYNLQSEMFAEKLLLEENGLPPKAECNAEDYAAAVAAIEAFNAIRLQKKELKAELDKAQTTAVEYEYNRLVAEYEAISAQVDIFLKASDEVAKLIPPETIAEALSKQAAAETAKSNYMRDFYDPAMKKKNTLQDAYNLIGIEERDLREAADDAMEKVIAPWREDQEIKNQITQIMQSVTYEYESLIVPTSKEEGSESYTQNKGYIKITIDVGDDEALASFLIERFKSRVPGFVETHIEEITGTTIATCKLISTFADVEHTEANYIKAAVKNAIAGAIGAVVLVYAFFVLKLLALSSEKKRDRVEKELPVLTEKEQEETVE